MIADTSAGERGHRLAVLGTLALIVACQLVGAAVLDSIFLHSGERRRNPNFRRLWPDYVLATQPKAEGETLILVISNSQGYGAELPARMIYTSRLAEEMSDRTGAPVRVENWSVMSGNASDFSLLSALAHRIHPDVTLLLASPRNFSRKFRWQDGEKISLDFALPDTKQLLAYSDVRANLSGAFQDFYVDLNQRIDAALGRFMPLWRYRDLPRVIPYEYPALRPFSKKTEQQHWLYDNPSAPLEFKRSERQRMRELPVPVMSWELLEETAEAFASVPGRRIFIHMPAYSTNADFPNFAARAGVIFEKRGAEVWDLERAVGDDGFVSNSHLNEQGHAVLAKILAERLSQ